MAIGPKNDPISAGHSGISGAINTVIFSLMGFIGGVFATVRAAAAAYVNEVEHYVLTESPNTVIDPGTAAVAAIKGVVEVGAAADEARLSGINGERFDALYKIAMQAPGADTLLSMFRLGRITDGELALGLHQQQFAEVWIDAIRSLQFEPISPIQYLQGAVQGHYDHDEAIHQATLQGITADDAEVIYQTLGDPPGVMQMLELMNREILTQDEVIQGIRESRIKNKYTDDILQLAIYIPPVRTITALLRSGAVDEANARQLYKYNGVQPDVIDAYVASALHGKVASHKQVSVGTVKSLFVDHLITRDQALAWLAQIGYLPADSDMLLTLATFEAEQKLHAQTITKIRTLFVGKHIDEATALADLTHLNVDMTQQADLLDLWKLEQQTPSKELTLAQLTAMAKANVIDQATWMARIEALGYSAADAALLAALDFPAPAT